MLTRDYSELGGVLDVVKMATGPIVGYFVVDPASQYAESIELSKDPGQSTTDAAIQSIQKDAAAVAQKSPGEILDTAVAYHEQRISEDVDAICKANPSLPACKSRCEAQCKAEGRWFCLCLGWEDYAKIAAVGIAAMAGLYALSQVTAFGRLVTGR